MKKKSSSVAGLNDSQVSSLLALGLMPQASRAAASAVELLLEARQDPRRRELDVLLADLQGPILAPDAGPLSFHRLTEISGAEAKALRGKSFLEALCSPHAGLTVLQKLAHYGELISGDAFLPSTRLTGVVVRALALAALAVRHAAALEPSDAETVGTVLRALARTSALPKPLRQFAHSAAVAFAGKGP